MFTISPESTPLLSPTESSKGLISPTVNPSPVIYLYKRMSWAAIQGKNNTVKLYTGIPTTKLFLFVANLLKQKHRKIHYKSGNTSSGEPKRYQISPIKLFCQQRPGRSRKLYIEDELLMTLMRIRLDPPVEDLAFRFQISAGHASKIITTFISFISLELEPLIYWPTPDETLAYKHHHFTGLFNKCEGIGDCTEHNIQHYSNPNAQYQSYSSYKSNNTLKKINFLYKIRFNFICFTFLWWYVYRSLHYRRHKYCIEIYTWFYCYV